MSRTQQQIEADRQRYEELRAAGQEQTLKGLPGLTAPDGAPITLSAVIHQERIPPDWYATMRLRRGEALRIVDEAGRSSVSLIGWREDDTSERINCADTIKVQWNVAVSKGRIILSDMGRVFLSVIEDTIGAHDVLVGGSTPASTIAAFGESGRNTQENFLAAASKIGLDIRDIPPCITFFAPVALDRAGRFHWQQGRKRPGDFVDLRAEMNVIVIVSNCPHPLDPARPASAGPVMLIRHRAAGATAEDVCRTASPEAARAFAFTDQLFA